MGFAVMNCFVWKLNCGIGFAMIEKAVDDPQAYLASPGSSLPAMSEALPAEAENGNRAAVKTKPDKHFIVSYSLKQNGEENQVPSKISDGT